MTSSRIALFAITLGICTSLKSQNYIDQYFTSSLTYTTVLNSTNQVSLPRDLEFKPNSDELWVANKGTSTGGSNVVAYKAGTTSQTSEYRKDSHTSHFMVYTSAIAFGENGQWAGVSEIKSTGSPSSTFMGPALWSSDTAITARVFQSNWMSGHPLGSHYDMLHQSPFAMGIAHDSATRYWVADGWNSNICLYDFAGDHGPGYEDHSDGIIYRYSDVSFTRVINVPGHMVLDKASGWLYYIDSGTKMLRRMNTNTGTVAGPLTVPSTANEALAGYWNVTGAVQETIDTFLTQICGVDVYNGRMVVSDFTNGNIYVYDVSGPSPIFMDTIITGQAGMQGIEIGFDGKIWFVNNTANTVVRIDMGPANNDATIEILSPLVNNYLANFYGTGFNQCAGSVSPVVKMTNIGSSTITSCAIYCALDGVTQSVYVWNGSLAPGADVTLTLSSVSPSQGEHLLTVYTSDPSGLPDGNPANDRREGSFRLIDPAMPIPFADGFGTTGFPSGGWSYTHYNPNNTMSRVTGVGGFGNSSECIRMDNFSGAEDITGQKDHLISPRLDLTAATISTQLMFSYAYSQYDASSADRLLVKISTDCGATWITEFDQSGTTLATTTPHTAAYNAPLPGEWVAVNISLAAYIGQPDVMIMFETVSNYGNNLFIDDVEVTDPLGIPGEEITDVTIFPSPTSGICFVETALAPGETGTITVTSISGQLISSQTITSDRTMLDLTAEAAGTYFVCVTTENSGVVSKRVVKE